MVTSSCFAGAARGVAVAVMIAAIAGCGSSSRPSTTDSSPDVSGWSIPAPVTNGLGDASAVQVAANATGAAVAVWQQSDGGRINVYASRYAPGSGWQPAELLETDDSGDATHPRVAINGSGVIFAVWQQSNGTRTSIYSNRYSATGGQWGGMALMETDWAATLDDPDRLSIHLDGDAGLPDIAVNDAGNAFAVWQHFDGSRFRSVVRQYIDGLDWELPLLLDDHNSGDATLPRVAMNGSGTAFAVWQRFDGSRTSIYASRYSNHPLARKWGGAGPIETDQAATPAQPGIPPIPLNGDAENPIVAIDDAGNAFAAWQHHDGTRFNIVANRYVDGLDWSTPVLLETGDLGDATLPRIAMNASGTAFAVWQQSDGTRTNILACRFDSTSGALHWEAATPIDTDDRGDAAHPEIAVDPAGNAYAAWRQSDGLRLNMLAARFANGTSWDAPVFIDTDDSHDAGLPSVAVDGHGTAFVAWPQSDGMRTQIHAAQYTP